MKFIYAVVLQLFFLAGHSQQANEATNFIKECLLSTKGNNAIKTARYHLDILQYQYTQSYSPDVLTAVTFHNNVMLDFEHIMFNAEFFNAFPGGSEFSVRQIGANDSLLYIVDLLGNNTGQSILQRSSESRKAIFQSFHPNFQSIILENLLNETASLELIKADSITKRDQTLVRCTSLKNAVSDYYFNNKTKLLDKVVTHGEDFYTGKWTQETNYQDYKKFGGIAVSQLITTYRNQTLYSIQHLSSLEINNTTAINLFDAPTGKIIAPKDIAPPEQLLEVAKDIYIIERISAGASTPLNIAFVNMDDYIIVLEAPNDNEFSQKVIKKIKQTIPNKPIKYAFATHFHSDHSGGLRQYASEGATILIAEGTRKAVEGLLSRTIDDDFSKQMKIAVFETFRDKKTIKDAHHTIEFHDVRDSHADGDAFVYFPNEKIIYQGDHIIAPRDGTLPPMNRLTKDFFDYLEKNNIEVNRIMGAHGTTNFTKGQIDKLRFRNK
jgi:glyoxylase-like metal-dependent hydrolase (beta-lactamase superfamily II)